MIPIMKKRGFILSAVKPNSKQSIPIEEFLDEKLLFGDIASHTKQKGYCWGSNEYFEKRYKVSSRTISRWINDFGKTAVKETGIDEVSQETLDNLPF